MKKILQLYNNWARNRVNKSENGYASYRMFNDLLKNSEITLLSWLTGGVSKEDKISPIPYELQKNKDYIKRFLTTATGINKIVIPNDYYYFDSLYKFNTKNKQNVEIKNNCDHNDLSVITTEMLSLFDIDIPLLDTDKFNGLCNSSIDEIRPNKNRPIARLNSLHQFEFSPNDIGFVKLDYIRYPKFGQIKTKIDNTYNDEVFDEAATIDIEWDEWALPYLLNLLTNEFSTHTREKALADHNSTHKITS